MAESLMTIQKELASAKEAKKDEDAKKISGSVFDHKSSSLIQPAIGSVLVQHEKAAPVMILTDAGK